MVGPFISHLLINKVTNLRENDHDDLLVSIIYNKKLYHEQHDNCIEIIHINHLTIERERRIQNFDIVSR